jgi:hypothetical protein
MDGCNTNGIYCLIIQKSKIPKCIIYFLSVEKEYFALKVEITQIYYFTML